MSVTTPDDFVVLTQNAFGVGPRWDLRRGVIARRLDRVRPDVIGLQEVLSPSVDGRSQAHELADLIGGYHVDFAPGKIRADGTCEGVALLCKNGIRERSVESLTLDPTDFFDRAGQRVVLCAMLDLPSGPLDVFVTHLSLSRRARERTAFELMTFAARERTRSGSHGAVLMGDLNAQPAESIIGALETCGSRWGGPWTDTWKSANGNRGRGATWPAIAPFRRLDYIFVQPAPTWSVCTCDLEPVSGSDHRGLLARIRLAG